MARVPARQAIGRTSAKPKTRSWAQREPIAELEDIRDDCIAVVINSGQSFKAIHDKGGPSPQTTSKWLYKETRFPQFATIRAMLNACGHDLTIAPKGHARIRRVNTSGIQMPPKQVKKKA